MALSMTTNGRPMFYDITFLYSDSFLGAKFEDIQGRGVRVPIDPGDQDAVIAYFKDPTQVRQVRATLSIDRKTEYKNRQPHGRMKLRYLVPGRDGLLNSVSKILEPEYLERGCCITLLHAGQSNDTISMSQITQAKAVAIDELFSRTRWTPLA